MVMMGHIEHKTYHIMIVLDILAFIRLIKMHVGNIFF